METTSQAASSAKEQPTSQEPEIEVEQTGLTFPVFRSFDRENKKPRPNLTPANILLMQRTRTARCPCDHRY